MNKKQELFSDAMGELDSRYLEPILSELPDISKKTGAITQQAPKKYWKNYRVLSALAACLCLVVSGIGLHFWLQGNSEKNWQVKEIPYPQPEEEIAEIPRWEDLPIYGQYAEIKPEHPDFSEISFSTRSATLLPEQLEPGARSIPAVAIGWDEYAEAAGGDGQTTCRATLYPITGISSECAMAVRYEGSDAYYAVVNSFYRPQTLGQFADSLNLSETLRFNYALYEYTKDSGEPATVQFESLDNRLLWDLLFTASEAENEYDDLDHFYDSHQKQLNFSISIPLLGYENISISLWNGGYLETNILDTGKRFHIGEEAVQKVLDYIFNECEGYEIIYTYEENETGIPE